MLLGYIAVKKVNALKSDVESIATFAHYFMFPLMRYMKKEIMMYYEVIAYAVYQREEE